MSTEQEVVTDAPTETIAPEVTETPEVVTQEATESAGEETKESEEVTKEEPTELELQLKALERRAKKAERNNARMYAELEQWKAKVAQPVPEEKQETTQVVELARQIAKVERFNEEAESAISRGQKQFSDFNELTNELASEVGALRLPDGRPAPFVEVLFKASKTPEVLIAHLGKNPDIAAGLVNLDPITLGIELSSLQRTLNEKQTPKISNAPKPLEPVRPKSTSSNLPSDDDPVEVWIAKERKRMDAART